MAGCLWVANNDDENDDDDQNNNKDPSSFSSSSNSSSSSWRDLRRVGPAGFALPGCPLAVRNLRVLSDARFLLVVEKDACFERLVEDRVWESVAGGCVVVTAKGMPDLSTRAFCSHLLCSSSSSSTKSKPTMQVLGLCDWNPSGVAILAVYKNGSLSPSSASSSAAAASASAASAAASAPSSSSLSARASLEGAAYALPSLRWLGARSEWFLRAGTRDEALQPLAARDLATARSLAAALSSSYDSCSAPSENGGGKEPSSQQYQHPWVRELEAMAAAGVKAELEAVEDGTEEGMTGLGTLSAFVAEAANAGDWI